MLSDNFTEVSFIRAKSHILRKEFAKAEEIYRNILSRLPKKYPDAFIYHYNDYEKKALRELASEYSSKFPKGN